MQVVHALFTLAWALLRSLFSRLFGGARGIAAFRRQYEADRLPPLAPDERRLLPTFGGCIACGLCEVGEGVRIAASYGAYAGPMDLVLASSRSMPDFDVGAVSFAALTDERLAELEARCPTRVPMRKIAAFVRAKAMEVSGASRGVDSPVARRGDAPDDFRGKSSEVMP